MGFIIKYRLLLSVIVEEEGGTQLPGFQFFPSQSCSRKLHNYNLVFRSRSSGFEIFYSKTPLIPISERIRFTFGFTLPNGGIFKKYGLAKTDPSDSTHYQPGLFFDNLNGSGAVISGSSPQHISQGATVAAADTFNIFGQTFNVFDSTKNAPPSSYELMHKYKPSLTQTIPVSGDATPGYVVTTINSTSKANEYLAESGPYSLKADVNPPADRNVYLNNELVQKSAQGVINIYWENSQASVPESGQQYLITFKPT